MRIEKMVWEQMEIAIGDITLLSVDEYDMYRANISVIDDWWWLRSPGAYSYYAAFVNSDGSVLTYGGLVDVDYAVVRPVVAVRLNPESPNLRIGDKLHFAGYIWTMIAPDMALCDDGVGQTCYRKDWEAPNANDYEKSDIKMWLERWARKHGIEIEPKEG